MKKVVELEKKVKGSMPSVSENECDDGETDLRKMVSSMRALEEHIEEYRGKQQFAVLGAQWPRKAAVTAATKRMQLHSAVASRRRMTAAEANARVVIGKERKVQQVGRQCFMSILLYKQKMEFVRGKHFRP